VSTHPALPTIDPVILTARLRSGALNCDQRITASPGHVPDAISNDGYRTDLISSATEVPPAVTERGGNPLIRANPAAGLWQPGGKVIANPYNGNGRNPPSSPRESRVIAALRSGATTMVGMFVEGRGR
jgi:hypothetical protein